VTRIPARSLVVGSVATAFVTAFGLTATASAASDETLYVFPDAGQTSVYNLIDSATSSLDMTMYELEDTTAEQDLAARAKAGVDVRVILDEREKSNNTAAYTYLTDNGVHVVYSSTSYYYTHQKTIVVDNATAYILTENLQTQYYSTSRDYGVVDTDSADVAAIVKVFNADYAGTAITPGDGDGLVWSPTDSQSHLLSVINGATSTLWVENEEMADTTITNALAAQAKAGVTVNIIMTNDANDYASEFDTLTSAGAHVVTYAEDASLYIHGKVILADYGTSAAKVFIGSENFSNTSLNSNRELGLITSDSAVMSGVHSAVTSDYDGGTPWS
jgi:phosphatidylserine/phosphatidylglycerophosphate/cardiolipin synthase-like enzyme